MHTHNIAIICPHGLPPLPGAIFNLGWVCLPCTSSQFGRRCQCSFSLQIINQEKDTPQAWQKERLGDSLIIQAACQVGQRTSPLTPGPNEPPAFSATPFRTESPPSGCVSRAEWDTIQLRSAGPRQAGSSSPAGLSVALYCPAVGLVGGQVAFFKMQASASRWHWFRGLNSE